MFNKFESFITRAQEAINTLQVKVGKDADEQARITIKLANLHWATRYCKAVLVKNGYTPTDEKTIVAFNSVSYDTKDLESAPVLTTLDDVYAAYITFRGLLAETDGFMYRMWIKTGVIVTTGVVQQYINSDTRCFIWNNTVYLWTRREGFYVNECIPKPNSSDREEGERVVLELVGKLSKSLLSKAGFMALKLVLSSYLSLDF